MPIAHPHCWQHWPECSISSMSPSALSAGANGFNPYPYFADKVKISVTVKLQQQSNANMFTGLQQKWLAQ